MKWLHYPGIDLDGATVVELFDLQLVVKVCSCRWSMVVVFYIFINNFHFFMFNFQLNCQITQRKVRNTIPMKTKIKIISTI